ncbi:hypothetical protein CLCR_04388 [Cladophialophora carrionii]|uniref:Uncharacterized protein n=1 Tax=Cladophialophora carrionii TaxID=86049 RepID=A0A1C1CJ92_9EURO|nr:hypothetical protein CLCR_04388 [Cladophialophora carrionii]
MVLAHSPPQPKQQTREEAAARSNDAGGAQQDYSREAAIKANDRSAPEMCSTPVDRSVVSTNTQHCQERTKPAKKVAFASPVAQIQEITPVRARRSARLKERAHPPSKAAPSASRLTVEYSAPSRAEDRDRPGGQIYRDENANDTAKGPRLGTRLRSTDAKSGRTPTLPARPVV